MKYKVNFEIEFNKNKYPGKFIVVEGIEASGKTTQVENLEKELARKKIKVWSTKNPTSHPIGKFIRRVLSGKVKIPPQSIQYLFNADRVVQQEEILSKLKSGYVVISDRYFWSSVAYGTADIKTDYENLINLSLTSFSLLSMYHEFIVPDVTFLLDVSIEEADKRLSQSHKHKEIYDNREMNIKVKKGYDWLVKKFPRQFTVIDGNHHIDKVTKEIISKIKLLKTSHT